MKKILSVVLANLVVAICVFFVACSTYTQSLTFYEIQDNDHIGYPTGEVAVVENTDKSIKKLIIPSTYNNKPVTTIWVEVFMCCHQLTEVELSSSIKYIEEGAFIFCENLRMLNLPESLLYIGVSCFEKDSELTEIHFSNKIFKINKDAFKDCTKLQDVYYNGTQEDWGQIEILEGNDCLLNANIHFSE